MYFNRDSAPVTVLQPLAASDVVDISAICPGRVHDDEALAALTWAQGFNTRTPDASAVFSTLTARGTPR